MSQISRRQWLGSASAAAGLSMIGAKTGLLAETKDDSPFEFVPNRIAVSTYSFWRYNDSTKLPILDCIEQAARMGFDGVEILHVQMEDESRGQLQKLKRSAFVNGLDLCGFSTHQDFVSPDVDERKKNIERTKHCIELAYMLGIPTIRVNTGRWRTISSFDELMANKGIEPRLDGYSDEDGFSLAAGDTRYRELFRKHL
jgi:L-ribulose-5-phosphate 3-epimerase